MSTSLRVRIPAALLLLVLLVSACSSGPSSGSAQPDPPAPVPGGTPCGTVDVPAHEGVDVLAYGIGCPAARDVVRAAGGRGRAAYDAGGFTCTPGAAPGGDTSYDCVAGEGRRITFRYGVV